MSKDDLGDNGSVGRYSPEQIETMERILNTLGVAAYHEYNAVVGCRAWSAGAVNVTTHYGAIGAYAQAHLAQAYGVDEAKFKEINKAIANADLAAIKENKGEIPATIEAIRDEIGRVLKDFGLPANAWPGAIAAPAFIDGLTYEQLQANGISITQAAKDLFSTVTGAATGALSYTSFTEKVNAQIDAGVLSVTSNGMITNPLDQFGQVLGYTGMANVPPGCVAPPSSIASMLDNYGIGTPAVGSMNMGSLPGAAVSSVPSAPSYESPLGIASSLDVAGKGLGMGIGPSLANGAMPSMSVEAAMEMQAAQAAAAAAARHEAFVARTEMEADMLNNQQLAEIGIKNAMVDRWAAAAGYYSSPDVAEVGAFDEKAFAAAMTQTMAQTMVNATISAVGMFTPGIGPAAAFAGLMSPHEAAPDAPAPTAPTTQYGMIEAAFTSVDANGFTSLDNGALRDFMNQTAPTPGQAFGTTGMTVIEAMQVARENQNGKGSPSSGSSSGTGTGTAEGEAETSSGPAGPGGNPYADREAAAQGKSSTSSGTSSTSGNDKGSSGGSDGGDGEGGDGGSESGSGNEGGSGSYAPVVLDLDGDGVELVDASAGAQYDTNDDGTRERLGWAGKDDGLLAIDLDGDGKITGAKELSFAMHTAEQGDTDLQGLAKVFDSNKDGVLDSNDKAFDKFRIWQDKDGDGISDKGEVKTLSEMGIKSIGVVSDGKAYMDAGNTVHGTASYTKTDGTTRSVGDVDFKIAPTNETNKGNKPTAPNNVGDDEDGDDEDFDRSARQALTGKIPTRLPEMSTSGSAIAMATYASRAQAANTQSYARAA
jgi:hypothetical protein